MHPSQTQGGLGRRLLWFLLLYAAGVGATLAVAGALKAILLHAGSGS